MRGGQPRSTGDPGGVGGGRESSTGGSVHFLLWKMKFQFNSPVTPGTEGAPDHLGLPWDLSLEVSPW